FKNFSLRLRPCRNSFRCSSEEVVIGILPPPFGSELAAVLSALVLLVLSATFEQPVSAIVAVTSRHSNSSMDLLCDIGVLLRTEVSTTCGSRLVFPAFAQGERMTPEL